MRFDRVKKFWILLIDGPDGSPDHFDAFGCHFSQRLSTWTRRHAEAVHQGFDGERVSKSAGDCKTLVFFHGLDSDDLEKGVETFFEFLGPVSVSREDCSCEIR